MDIISFIAEQKISQALAERDLNSPQWKNRPLPLEDHPHVPEQLRMAYTLLKNAGYLPPEIEARKEITRLEELIATTEDAHQRLKQMHKLNVLMMKVNAGRPVPANIAQDDAYYQRIVEKISLRSAPSGPDR